MVAKWDVIVVGAGTAGMPAAIFASQRGAKVLLIEQDYKVGGTLHFSGGQLAAAGTRLAREKGIDDTAEEHYANIMRICNGTADPELTRTWVQQAGPTIDWLMSLGFDMAPEPPAVLDVHEPYDARRSYWGNEAGLSLIKAMKQALETEIASGGVTLKLETEFIDLLRDSGGRVTGVTVRSKQADKAEDYAGENVVIATGGYAANREMFAKYSPGLPYCSATNPQSKGTGLAALEAAGAGIDGGDKVIPSYGCVLDDPDDPTSRTFIGGPGDALSAYVWLNTSPQFRRPWEIHVNLEGKRFVREDVPSVDARERALLEQREWKFFIFFDEGIRQNAPPITSRWSEAALKHALGTHPSFLKAETLEGLAEQMRVSSAALQKTIAEYNEAVAEQKDGMFGREFLPRRINKAPFYAIRSTGMTVMSPAGVKLDSRCRVLDQNERPIPNLYAAGEVMGYTRLSGKAYVPGSSVTPAIALGRMLGREILQWGRDISEAPVAAE